MRPIHVAILVLGVGSCQPPAAASPRAASHAPAKDEWATDSWEDRHDTMTFLVLPNMARTFQTFFGKKDPDMTCETCHGNDAEAVAYKMPRGLPPLDPRHLPRRDASNPNEARMAAFMIDEVTPRMARMLETPPYDPATRTGFSCFSCHPSREP